MLRKFLLYGAAGWVVEVLFTGASSALHRDRAATAKTYLWMHPIYGATALGMEWAGRRMTRAPLLVRGLAYTALIYAAEYSSGWLLRRALGRCPWDYTGSGRDVHGLVRLDYAPAWFALGLLFERGAQSRLLSEPCSSGWKSRRTGIGSLGPGGSALLP